MSLTLNLNLNFNLNLNLYFIWISFEFEFLHLKSNSFCPLPFALICSQSTSTHLAGSCRCCSRAAMSVKAGVLKKPAGALKKKLEVSSLAAHCLFDFKVLAHMWTVLDACIGQCLSTRGSAVSFGPWRLSKSSQSPRGHAAWSGSLRMRWRLGSIGV